MLHSMHVELTVHAEFAAFNLNRTAMRCSNEHSTTLYFESTDYIYTRNRLYMIKRQLFVILYTLNRLRIFFFTFVHTLDLMSLFDFKFISELKITLFVSH